MKARVVREDGSEAGWNEFGELWIRGANVFLGYWNNETATKEVLVNGWLRTGDGFRVDDDQYF
jgi:long-subunit acyl-CoA synthetase (AMP-forming)